MRSNLLFKIIGTAVAVLLFITGLASGVAADASDAKARDIRKLLEASGIYDQLNLMKNNLLNQYSMGFSRAYPKTPDAFWQEYYQLIGQQDIDALVERMIPVYDKNMSHEVIRKLIEMFETPFWEEWKVKMPAISREAGQIGSVWGQELLQSDAFNNSLKALIRNHGLEDLNE
ncbi:MAG: DUF2059 domain-containing protein [Nitrospinae bacterium]|nr:DUF2059 domain-containing protein [Nitrospinota bacterium]